MSACIYSYKYLEDLWIEGYCKFICDNEDKIDWNRLSDNPNITWEIIQNNPEKDWDWYGISRNPSITWDIIQNNPDKNWRWDYISCNPNITWKIIQNNPDKDWYWGYNGISYNTMTKGKKVYLEIKWQKAKKDGSMIKGCVLSKHYKYNAIGAIAVVIRNMY